MQTLTEADADPFDLLCHVAFNAPLRTRRERAEMLRKERKDFFDKHSPEARAVLDEMDLVPRILVGKNRWFRAQTSTSGKGKKSDLRSIFSRSSRR